MEKPTCIGVPQATRSEAKGLWPLLRRKSETPETIRALIDVSPEEAASLAREIGSLSKGFIEYRKRVLSEWDALIARRGITP